MKIGFYKLGLNGNFLGVVEGKIESDYGLNFNDLYNDINTFSLAVILSSLKTLFFKISNF